MSNNDFNSKQKTNVPAFTMDLSSRDNSHSFTQVPTAAGTTLNVPEKQVPMYGDVSVRNLWRYQSTGNINALLVNGGQANIKIDRGSGSGRVKSARLRLQITNASGSIQYMIPTPLWIQLLNWQTPSGTIEQQWDGTTLWFLNVLFNTYDHWTLASIYMLSSLDYQLAQPIAIGATKLVYIDMPGNWMEASDFLISAIDGDGQLYITFQPQTVTVVYPSGSTAPTLNQLSLEVMMETITTEQLDDEKVQLKSMRTDYIVPYCRRQTVSQTWTAGQTYNLPLSSIKGDVVFALFALRAPTTNGSSLVGTDLTTTCPVAQFQFLNSSGVSISGQQIIDSSWNRLVDLGNQFLGQYNRYNKLYGFTFADDDDSAMAFIANGLKKGSYPFTTNETIQLIMSGAGTSEVITVVSVAGVLTAGHFYVVLYTPFGSSVSAPIAYNATTATIAAAIEEMPNFQGTVAVANAFTANSGSVAITFGSNYANKPMFANGYSIQVVATDAVTTGPVAAQFSSTVTTPGVDGITSGGTYIWDGFFFTSNIISQLNDGSLAVSSS